MSDTPRKPDLRLFLVVKNNLDSPQSSWIPMGAAWANADGRGYSLSIDFLPIRMPGKSYDFVLRTPLEDQTDDTQAPDNRAF